MFSDNLIMEKIEKNKERGIRLGIFKSGDKPDIETLLDTDIIWHILEISHKIEVFDAEGREDVDTVHKMMLQYANLNKIRAVNRQTRNKAENAQSVESMFDKIVKEQIMKEKKDISEQKTKIVEKVVLGKNLTQEEQDILDAAEEMI